jgi:hypothetical protein
MLISTVKPLGRFSQQPWEIRRYRLDYTEALGDTETIVTPTFLVDPTSTTPFAITNAAVDVTGKFLVFYASGGEDGTSYQVSVRVVTSAGQQFEDEVEFLIEER